MHPLILVGYMQGVIERLKMNAAKVIAQAGAYLLSAGGTTYIPAVAPR